MLNRKCLSRGTWIEVRKIGLIADVCVSQLEVPASLNLLPGQIHMLREAVDKETERLAEKAAAARPSITVATTDAGNYQAVLSEMPA